MAEPHGTNLDFVTNSRTAEPDTRNHQPAGPGTESHPQERRAALLVPPGMCHQADARLAHEQMRAHLGCRIERCAWKAAAYRTLVITGRLTPQAVSHRERAAARGMDFPSHDGTRSAEHTLDVHTIQAVLERLSTLTPPPETLRG
ncbi:hypothetical protein [Nocardia sp. NPDC057455]|uniref:hypothetical protein n=1 Tax=Nocardia sp. NPDC057455 TaxID=3346138 RepID=UPI003671E718